MSDKYINPSGLQTIKTWVESKIPVSTSDLINDSNFVVDASYVHTDNNFTSTLKSKLDGIASGAEVNVNADWDASSGDAQILNKPSIPSGSSTSPKMDGTATVGTETTWAHGDHVHPSDTNKQNKITANGILKGNGSGTITAAVAGTDYQSPLIAGTDYQTPLPTQTGNNGKFLTTNGSNLSWGTPSGGVTFIEIEYDQIDTGNYNQTIGEAINAAYDAGQQVVIQQPIPSEGYYYYYLFNAQATETSRSYTFYQLYHGGWSQGVITVAGMALFAIDCHNNEWSIYSAYCQLQSGGGSVQIDTSTLSTSATTQTVTASGTNVCNVQVVDSVTHEQVITDVIINGNSVTVTVAAAPTNTLNITVMSY